jgi:glycosyltransferase involved in cell wall biosynthesis
MRVLNSVCLMVTNEISASTFYRGYLTFLRERGWEVSVVASSNGTLHELGRREGVATHDLQMRRNPSPAADIVSLFRAIALLLELRPEIVVAATPKAGLLGMISAWVTRVPVRVYQLWGLRLETERGLRRVIFTILETIAARLATQVVANSASLAKAAERMHIAKDIVVLGAGSSHGVDLQYFSRCNAEMPEPQADVVDFFRRNASVVTIGYIGRVNKDKGIVTLVHAAEICARAGLHVNLMVVGPEEDRALEELLASSKASGVSVLRVGPVEDTRPYFLLMDVLCLPTLREGFPNVVLEAAALGIPTITTRATGAIDSVLHDVTGVLVDVGDAAQLAAAMSKLATDAALRKRLGQSAKRRAINSFSDTVVFSLQEQNLQNQRACVRLMQKRRWLRLKRSGHG